MGQIYWIEFDGDPVPCLEGLKVVEAQSGEIVVWKGEGAAEKVDVGVVVRERVMKVGCLQVHHVPEYHFDVQHLQQYTVLAACMICARYRNLNSG